MRDFIVVIQHCYFCKHSVKMSYELFSKFFLTMAFHIFLQSVRPLVRAFRVAFHVFQLVPSVITHFPVWFSFMFLRFSGHPEPSGCIRKQAGTFPHKKGCFWHSSKLSAVKTDWAKLDLEGRTWHSYISDAILDSPKSFQNRARQFFLFTFLEVIASNEKNNISNWFTKVNYLFSDMFF